MLVLLQIDRRISMLARIQYVYTYYYSIAKLSIAQHAAVASVWLKLDLVDICDTHIYVLRSTYVEIVGLILLLALCVILSSFFIILHVFMLLLSIQFINIQSMCTYPPSYMYVHVPRDDCGDGCDVLSRYSNKHLFF